MVCNFRAVKRHPVPLPASPPPAAVRPPTRRWRGPVVAGLACALALCAAGARAERADRLKDLVIESDSHRGATLDLTKRTSVISGNVIVSQGTMQIRADRLELREQPDGRRLVTASGAPGQTATFRQKRDGVDEHVEASAQRIEYDSGSERVRFVGDARVRRVTPRGVADEATAQVIAYDSIADLISLVGQGDTPAAGNGRTRLVFSPREAPASAAPAAPDTPPGR